MHALIIGATGATGKDLLDVLLQDQTFQRVDIFVRRPITIKHKKLHVHVITFDQPESWRHLVKGDVLFSCLGTTLRAAGSKAAQWKIDHDYQLEFAKAAKENGVPHLVLVSSAQASPDAAFFYPKMKGKLEEKVKSLAFPSLTIFRPPVLVRKNSDRKMEVAAIKILRLLNKAGLLRSQEPLETALLAQSMVNAAKRKRSGVTITEGAAIRKSL